MSFLSRVFRSAPATGASEAATGLPSQGAAAPASAASTRRELLRVVLRDTLIKHGIPNAWLSCEMLATSGGGRTAGMHLRLLVKHWDPRLLKHGVAFENSLCQRAALFDPEATDWLTGISWQFALDDPAACPAMPDPAIWTTPYAEPAQAAGTPAQLDKVAQLKQQFAEADAKRQPLSDPGFEPTQAMFAPTQTGNF